MHGPARTSSFLPWLLASTALHGLLLMQWPDARQPAAGGNRGVPPIELRLSPAPSAAHPPPRPQPALASTAGTPPRAPHPERAALRPAPARPAAPAAETPTPAPDAAPHRPAPTAAPAAPDAVDAVDAGAPDRGTGDDAGSAWLELSTLLHQAIDRHKRYPQSALRMGREGAARIDFLLGPDGRIDELNIGHSSGVPSLDLAAFRAVQAIAPFTDAQRYLDRARRFQVDVVFRIN